MKLLILHLSPVSCHLIPLRPKYLPHHSTVAHLHAYVVPQMDNPNFTSTQTCKIIVLCILITMFLDSKREGKGSEYHVTAHKPTCYNLQARRVELNNAASSEGCSFCWLKINQNNTQCSLRLFRSDRVSMYFPNNLQNICSNTKQCTHVLPSR